MSKIIESEFRKSFRSFFLWFLDPEFEKDYQMNLQENEQILSSKIESFLILLQYLLSLLIQAHELYLSMQGDPRFQLNNELLIDCTLLVAFIIEIIKIGRASCRERV